MTRSLKLQGARTSKSQCCSVIVAGCDPAGCVSTQNFGHHDGSVLVLITFKVCMLLLGCARRSDMDPCSSWWPQQHASRPATGPSTTFLPRRGQLPASPYAPMIPRRISSRGEGCAQVEVQTTSSFCSVAQFPFLSVPGPPLGGFQVIRGLHLTGHLKLSCS